MNLTGFRTILVAVIGGTITPLLAQKGFALSPDQQAWLVSGTMSVAMIAMRLITKTPVGKSQPKPAA
jgi:hypothetical protein